MRRIDEVRALGERLCAQLADLAGQVSSSEEARAAAFEAERRAEQKLLLEVLESVRPALASIADHEGPVVGLVGERPYRQTTIDHWSNRQAPDQAYTWVAFEHPEIGLCVGKRLVARPAELVWPSQALPYGREGGPRLAEVLERLLDRLSSHLGGNAARRRREATQMMDRLRAVQILMESGK